MKKKFFLILFSILLCCSLAAPAFAAGSRTAALVSDNTGTLTSSELTALNEKAERISAKYSCDVAVAFVPDIGQYRSITDFADDLFDSNHFGYGGSEDGVMLVVDMTGREYWITTSGYGIDAFTDAGQYYLKDEFVSDLSAGRWAGAADAFLSGCERYLRQAATGTPYDVQNEPRKNFSPEALAGTSVLGLLLGGLPLRRQKKEMESVREQKNADLYGADFKLTARDEHFLGKNVSRVPIPKSSPTMHTGGGGGSSIHISSSGHSHGGSGGHF